MTELLHRRADGAVWRAHRGSILVARPGGEPQQLDGAAALVWVELSPDGSGEGAPGVTVADLVARTTGRWPDPADLAGQVGAVLAALEDAGLVEVTAGPGAPA